ncbi:hypothetical protein K2173_025829 [Erythroxylum novogranatense]|uniref:Uncharacterized protein n=1 Tax=Erythroxylum novogranatense TaxID=1862640 RepID=A0AAV8SI52_9ROSI|nr:hypothetical protein K2173_025829 [Erythroxylum novogranatense]
MSLASNSTTTNGVQFLRWNSPIPYLFGGLALLLLLIAVALIILVFSYRRSLSNSRRQANIEKDVKQVEVKIDVEPPFAVIMAGDEQPTFLAKPACNCHKETNSEAPV